MNKHNETQLLAKFFKKICTKGLEFLCILQNDNDAHMLRLGYLRAVTHMGMTSGENFLVKFYRKVTNILLKKLWLLLTVISRLYHKIVFVFMKKAISYFAKLSTCQSSCTVEIHGFSHRALDIFSTCLKSRLATVHKQANGNSANTQPS